ncbi:MULTISPECIES: DUF6083 domain-containing protein [unclassified Streptomyces]|uniref:DUF6083 domain-containing protein n=1 Tax=unclassified Streptomyces TaxID=2593676 RepID=UPI00386BD843
MVVPTHTIPPRRRWIITTDGTAMNLWDAEPLPGTRCRIAHRMVCPYLPRDDLWPWTTALRQEPAAAAPSTTCAAITSTTRPDP